MGWAGSLLNCSRAYRFRTQERTIANAFANGFPVVKKFSTNFNFQVTHLKLANLLANLTKNKWNPTSWKPRSIEVEVMEMPIETSSDELNHSRTGWVNDNSLSWFKFRPWASFRGRCIDATVDRLTMRFGKTRLTAIHRPKILKKKDSNLFLRSQEKMITIRNLRTRLWFYSGSLRELRTLSSVSLNFLAFELDSFLENLKWPIQNFCSMSSIRH